MVIAGRTWEDPAVGGGPISLLVLGVEIAQDDPTLWTWEGFVSTTSQPSRALVQGILELPASDQTQHMRAIVEQRNIQRFAGNCNLFNRLWKKKQTLAQNNHLG